jgi:hypothetical protein
MGKNTMERQNFIIDNLVIEEDTHNCAPWNCRKSSHFTVVRDKIPVKTIDGYYMIRTCYRLYPHWQLWRNDL